MLKLHSSYLICLMLKSIELSSVPSKLLTDQQVQSKHLFSAYSASHPERCRSSCHRSQKIRAYDACSMRSSLATDSTAGHFQKSCSGVQVPARHGSTLPTGILSAAVICRQPPASVRALWSTDCSTNQDELRRPQFRRTGTSNMEQSSC